MKKLKPRKPKKPKPKKPKPKKPKPKRKKPNPEKPPKTGPGRPTPKKPPKPKPKLASGYIPAECAGLKDSPYLLDCWLDHHPAVANAILWQPPAGTAATPLVAWPLWSAAKKAELRQAWLHARSWYAGGMTIYPGTFVEDPPPNQDSMPDDAPFFRTVLDETTQAWPLFLAHVAHSLAAEIGGWVPWSLRTYEPKILESLLSGGEMFAYDTNDGGYFDSDHPGGYVVKEHATPSHPTFTFRFLKTNGLIGPTALATIGRVLDWCRWNLSHYFGTFTPQNADYHWQYRGAVPVRRVIDGTLLLDPQYAPTYPTPKHWTAGCWGTTAFLRSVLRAANIPVMAAISGGGHVVPFFAGAHRYLSHGDDPYNALAKASYPAELLLLTESTFASWFPHVPDSFNETAVKNVGRRVIELAVWHFSEELLNAYCSDVANGLDHASGKVFSCFAPHDFSVAQLEATDLWGRLSLAAQGAGKC
jgi:hypothetical protein